MANRKALILAYNYLPENSAGVFRTARFASHLPEFHWDPIIITATLGSEDKPASSEAPRVERVPVRGQGLKQTTSNKKSPEAANGSRDFPGKQALRSLSQLIFTTPDEKIAWIKSAIGAGRKILREESPDVLYTTGPPHSVHIAGLVLKRLSARPWVVDFRDPCARRPWTKNRNPWGNRLLPRIEKLIVSAADKVILNTERAADDFRSAYPSLPASRFRAIPNGCDPSVVEQARALRASVGAGSGPPQCLRLLHPGACYSQRDPRIVVDAVAELARRGHEIRFDQVGSCSPRFQIEDYARERQVKHLVCVEPPVSHEEILRRMAATDVLLLIQPETPLQVPSKLFEMMAFRKPILAVTDEGATADLMKQYRLGPVVASNDVSGLVDSLSELLVRKEQGITWNGETDAALSDFDGRMLTGRLAAILDELSPMDSSRLRSDSLVDAQPATV